MKSIKTARAYYYERLSGTIPVDENNNPINQKPDTVITIYIETNGQLPGWKRAWQNNQAYSIGMVMLNEKEIIVGKKFKSGEKIKLKRTAGNKLMMLELQQSENQRPPQTIASREILLEGLLNGKRFFYRIKKPIQIASPEFM